MRIFNLPDLGEGLPDAEVREWYVKEGDHITADQPMVAMETAKAVVDVPAPHTGVVAKLYGNPGDIIKTGTPLMEFVAEAGDREDKKPAACSGATVAGNIEVGNTVLRESPTGIKTTATASTGHAAAPAIRLMAEKLGVNLANIQGTGPAGKITAADVQKAKAMQATVSTAAPVVSKTIEVSGEALRGVRRAMANIMAQSHAEIVPVTLNDDADLHTWETNTDITLRVIRAIKVACQKEPALNAWFDGKQLIRQLHEKINLGLAMDSAEGLFVPVLFDIAAQQPQQLRDKIDLYKKQVTARSIPQQDLHGATIVLSNFGTMAGRYANPVVVPPCVAIIGTGKMREQVVLANGNIEAHKIMPLSITVDHRVITGGEAARFLAAMIADLQLSK